VNPFERDPDESAEDFLLRLGRLDWSTLPVDAREALVRSLRNAREEVRAHACLNGRSRPDGGFSTLEHCKSAIRRLKREEVQELCRWLAHDMKDD
jgi:hypothetical protein